MKKICFVTATRAEYGLLKWLMHEVKKSECFKLQLIVTGAHLLKEQGYTIDCIIEDGFRPDEIVDAMLDTSSTESIASTMGRMAELFSHSFAKLMPDYVVVLGDRYELLPIVNTAFVMYIPIIHLSGGDITEGAIDDGIRNAVTMLSKYHFPGTEDSAANIRRMLGTDKNIWAVGEPGLDFFCREPLLNRKDLAKDLKLEMGSKWALFTYHAETKESLEHNLDVVRFCVSLLVDIEGVQIVATYSNADYGGKYINEYLEGQAAKYPRRLKVIPSLGNRRYLSFMKQVDFVIGNSSSGIVEAPALGIPVINIGDRQKGRHVCQNVVQVDADKGDIEKAIKKAIDSPEVKKDNYWGDGHTAEKIMEIMKKELM